MPEDTLDDEYLEYLWGEASPRSFARKALKARTKQPRESRIVIMDASIDAADFVPR